jgi:hypothetical protein
LSFLIFWITDGSNFPQTSLTIKPARQNATAAIPCASTAKNGGVWKV